jgi:hypothetical protein
MINRFILHNLDKDIMEVLLTEPAMSKEILILMQKESVQQR